MTRLTTGAPAAMPLLTTRPAAGRAYHHRERRMTTP